MNPRVAACIIMVTAFCGVLLAPQTVLANTYSDVASSDADFAAISSLTNWGVISGSEDGQFHPDSPLTRCELAKIARLANAHRPNGQFLPLTGSGEPQEFSDIPTSHWCHHYVRELKYHNVLNGYPDGTFRPNQKVTQIEALKILINSLKAGPLQEDFINNRYTDVQSTDWWAPYIQHVMVYRLTYGHDEASYGIGKLMSRREAARITYNLLQIFDYSSN